METSSIILLVVSASISFGLGRLIVHLRDRKRKSQQQQSDKLAEEARRNLPPEPESHNKAKRKRQVKTAGRDAPSQRP
ncbi:MAG: hypothetical protein JWQ72_225 [Polaromonas sp.]|nr:hypothetical protein [Polaromonas sp.]